MLDLQNSEYRRNCDASGGCEAESGEVERGGYRKAGE